MAGVRVYELARDLGISSRNLIEELRNQGIEVKSHMSTMDEETAGWSLIYIVLVKRLLPRVPLQ